VIQLERLWPDIAHAPDGRPDCEIKWARTDNSPAASSGKQESN